MFTNSSRVACRGQLMDAMIEDGVWNCVSLFWNFLVTRWMLCLAGVFNLYEPLSLR